ncbi:putative olfactory receptor 1F12P [Gastrophryne carolinensis]
MENNTAILVFQLLPFFMQTNIALVFAVVFFFLIYFFGLQLNIVIILMICLHRHLYTPMYLFLCNLSIVDLCYINVIVPKLLHILLSGDRQVSFTKCFLQTYFLFTAASAENTVIFIMAYDRYVAICHPLHYHHILSKKTCTVFMVATWICSFFNSVFLTIPLKKMFFCSSLAIHHFLCDSKALVHISCSGRDLFYKIIYTEVFLYAVCPVMCNLISYVKIIRVILGIKSKDGRSKAFSTCSSHLIVMTIYYGSAASVYMMPPSDRYNVLEQILTVFFTTVIPVLNPLIYSIRNNELKSTLLKYMTFHDHSFALMSCH